MIGAHLSLSHLLGKLSQRMFMLAISSSCFIFPYGDLPILIEQLAAIQAEIPFNMLFRRLDHVQPPLASFLLTHFIYS